MRVSRRTGEKMRGEVGKIRRRVGGDGRRIRRRVGGEGRGKEWGGEERKGGKGTGEVGGRFEGEWGDESC